MGQLITGIHHVTAIASGAQKNIDFTSIYFREPGGVLFEVATSGPGFAIDEPGDHLGEALKLPEQFEPRRKELEKTLTPITFNDARYK
jgi:glyoxalase family protein